MLDLDGLLDQKHGFPFFTLNVQQLDPLKISEDIHEKGRGHPATSGSLERLATNYRKPGPEEMETGDISGRAARVDRFL